MTTPEVPPSPSQDVRPGESAAPERGHPAERALRQSVRQHIDQRRGVAPSSRFTPAQQRPQQQPSSQPAERGAESQTPPDSPPAQDPQPQTQQQPEPGGEGGESSQETEQRVPLERLNKVVSERKTLETENESLKKELAKLRKETDGKKLDEKIEDRLKAILEKAGGEVDGVDKDVIAQLSRATAEEVVEANRSSGEDDDLLREVAMERRVMRDLPDQRLSQRQASVVAKIRSESNLSSGDALVLARAKHPDLFAAQDERGFSASTHSTTRPSGASPASRPETAEQKKSRRLSELREARRSGKIDADEYAKEMWSTRFGS